MLNGLRLSLTNGQAISAEGTTGSTVYLVPHVHGRIELFFDSEWTVFTTTGASLALTGLVADSIYDVFAYYDTLTRAVKLELSVPWVGNFARTADDSITPMVTRLHGVYIKEGDPSRRYLGTMRTVTTTTVADTSAKRFLWNFYNKVDRTLSVIDSTNTWTYAGSAGGPNWRGANASTSSKIEVVVGFSNQSTAHFKSYGMHAAAAGTSADYSATPGVGIFTSGSNSAQLFGACPNSLTLFMTAQAENRHLMSSGYYPIWWLDGNNKSSSTQYLGDNGTTVAQSGMVGTIQG